MRAMTSCEEFHSRYSRYGSSPVTAIMKRPMARQRSSIRSGLMHPSSFRWKSVITSESMSSGPRLPRVRNIHLKAHATSLGNLYATRGSPDSNPFINDASAAENSDDM